MVGQDLSGLLRISPLPILVPATALLFPQCKLTWLEVGQPSFLVRRDSAGGWVAWLWALLMPRSSPFPEVALSLQRQLRVAEFFFTWRKKTSLPGIQSWGMTVV